MQGPLSPAEDGYLGAFASYTDEQVRSTRIGYLASVAFVDEEAGRILDALDTFGYAENTMVIFTSDHGDMRGGEHFPPQSHWSRNNPL